MLQEKLVALRKGLLVALERIKGKCTNIHEQIHAVVNGSEMETEVTDLRTVE